VVRRQTLRAQRWLLAVFIMVVCGGWQWGIFVSLTQPKFASLGDLWVFGVDGSLAIGFAVYAVIVVANDNYFMALSVAFGGVTITASFASAYFTIGSQHGGFGAPKQFSSLTSMLCTLRLERSQQPGPAPWHLSPRAHGR
jgi:hypothetical protein